MRFLGHLRSRIGLSEIDVETYGGELLRDFFNKLADILPELKHVVNDPLGEYLILINDVDVNVYGGINSVVIKSEDVITIIPIVHGGFA